VILNINKAVVKLYFKFILKIRIKKMTKIQTVGLSIIFLLIFSGCEQINQETVNNLSQNQVDEINETVEISQENQENKLVQNSKEKITNSSEILENNNQVVDKNYQALPTDEFLALRQAKNGILMDIRTAEEIAAKNIPTTNLELDYYDENFKTELNKLNKLVPYFIYCAHGNRTRTTKDIMKKMGFAEVYDLAGGIVTVE
jgi:rhodanese-related sulfurtransferase